MGDQLSVKARLVQLIISEEWTKFPLIKVSLYYFERRCCNMKRFVRTEITTTCMIKKQNKVIDRDKK
ncbi:hypothetical protein COM00_07450 [Bacillus toyonensis]|uniref:Uncharacterized protein n=1 Tax=Bacillus toyonensis TaxID=155322 RepID=A0AB73QW86_9BACI|nr:hypothetical protein CN678_14990 [Bacillus toyonensis]PEL48721.1 hypothetical protein CN638_23595 [Bacillus toyonensis]PGB64476.1 hypothetical protein COM00_07450 [Bacillus toyonensis]